MATKPIVGGLPLSLAGGGTSTTAPWFNRDFMYECAIGGVPYLLAISDKYPYRRGSTPWRKEQTDQSADPGEQSFTSWWLRSQSSFHGGAGITYYEPPSDDILRTRFVSSTGVDVWTKGRASLLRDTTEAQVLSGTTHVVGYDNAGTPMFLVGNGTAAYRNDGTSGVAATWGGAGTILDICQDGTNAYIADSTSIFSMPLTSGSGAAVWDTGDSNVTLGFVKQRLVAGIGPSIYELVGTGPTLPGPIYTHPNANWVWTSVTEGPDAVYASGYAGNVGALFKFTLEADGAMPTLTSATVAAELPVGEVPHAITTYLGAYMAIGTSAGVRIGVIGTGGEVQYGPLTVETDYPVRAFAARDRFVWAGVREIDGGNSGLVRIDLATEVEPLRFAYANDLQVVEAANVDSVSVFGTTDRLVIGCSGGWLEEAETLVSSGSITTGQVRYSTLEYKQFVGVSARTIMPGGTIAVSRVDDDDVVTNLYTLTADTDTREAIAFQSTSPAESLGMKFTLSRDANNDTVSPILKGWQLKALPHQYGVGETFQVPIMMFDFERDSEGREEGYEGWAFARWRSLREVLEAGAAVRFQDLRVGESLTVVIEDIQLEQTTPQAGTSTGWGGVAYLQLRQVVL